VGAVHLNEGDAKKAIPLLEQALTITREFGDRAVENDVLGGLGMAHLVLGQSQRAQELVELELSNARTSGNQFAIKLALEHLGYVFTVLGDAARALMAFEQALALAREVGDQNQEADLLWYASIQHADLGLREGAIANAQAAVDLMARIGRPQASLFADHLRKYQPEVRGQYVNQSFPEHANGQMAQGSGFLRMALAATKAIAKFVGSGLKTVSPQIQQQRVQTCALCDHHTGIRCRLCGCFTSVKVRLPHERCPMDKWPA
jgi:tetratricopeptide (TPR) repeat protein